MRQPQPCCSLRSVNISYVPSARYFQPSCGGLERLSILKWKGERIHRWQSFWKMLAKWGLKVNTERKDDFLNYTSCEQTQSEPGRDRVCEIVSHRGQSSSSTGFLCPFPFGGSFSRLFWEFLCLWLKHSISVPGQERLESTLCQSGHLHPCASPTSWLLFAAFLPIQPTHTRLDIMQGNIYWYSWPIFPPHQVNVHADTQQPEIPPPTFLWLHRAPRKQPTEMGCTSLYYIRAKTTRALTTATQPRRKVFRDVPHSLPCLSWIQALCAAKRDGHCYHTNMPTFMHQSKYFTLASCSPHDYSTRFPPLTHNHNEPHWLFD